MIRPPTSTEYRLLVENSPVMIGRAGLDAKCDYFNETWLEFTGRSLQQEMGDGWAEGVHPDDFQRCVDYYLDHFHRRLAFEMEYRLRRYDGEFRWIFDRGAPYTDDSGAFAGFIGSCVDVHERRSSQEVEQTHSQEQLALARDFERWILSIVSHDIRDPLGAIQLAAYAMQQHNTEQLQLARDFEKWILAIVGHDIRGPLGNILFAAHGLQQTAEPGSTTRKLADTVSRGVKRIEHIVGDLLDLSREREGSGISVERKPADLKAMCQEIIDELAHVAQDRRITFDCEADGRGQWDQGRILQAISNLASNAVQHGAPGSPVHVRLTGDPQSVAVEIRNEGSIPEDILPRMFEPFRSGRHHGSRGEGLGLGLFIAKAIARAHGGGVEVDSSGGSTMFRLVLPRHEAPAVA